jgi:ribosome-associated protein
MLYMKELEVITDAMLEKKGKEVCSMDLRKLGTAICDYFVICHADSGVQVAAIADEVEEKMLVTMKRPVVRSQGKENRFWVILDYSDIVVHIFQTEYRRFYRLEDLWADAQTHCYSD